MGVVARQMTKGQHEVLVVLALLRRHSHSPGRAARLLLGPAIHNKKKRLVKNSQRQRGGMIIGRGANGGGVGREVLGANADWIRVLEALLIWSPVGTLLEFVSIEGAGAVGEGRGADALAGVSTTPSSSSANTWSTGA